MTAQTNDIQTVAAAESTGEGHALPAGMRRETGAGATALGIVLALPRSVQIVGGAALGLGALLAVGVPLETLTPLVFLGGCLSMHLFMGHGMSHGGAHGSHDSDSGAPGPGSAGDRPTRPARDARRP